MNRLGTDIKGKSVGMRMADKHRGTGTGTDRVGEEAAANIVNISPGGTR